MSFPIQANPIAIAIAIGTFISGCLESSEENLSRPPSENPNRCGNLEADAQRTQVQFINRAHQPGYFRDLRGSHYAYELNCDRVENVRQAQEVGVRLAGGSMPVVAYTDALQAIRGVNIRHDPNQCVEIDGKEFCRVLDFFSSHISSAVLSFQIFNLHELDGHQFVFRGEQILNGCILASPFTLLKMEIKGTCR